MEFLWVEMFLRSYQYLEQSVATVTLVNVCAWHHIILILQLIGHLFLSGTEELYNNNCIMLVWFLKFQF